MAVDMSALTADLAAEPRDLDAIARDHRHLSPAELRDWLDLARAFAGPPGPGRPPKTGGPP